MILQVLQILLGILLLVLAGVIFRFTQLKIQRFDRKIRLYFGILCLVILGIAVITYGIDPPKKI